MAKYGKMFNAAKKSALRINKKYPTQPEKKSFLQEEEERATEIHKALAKKKRK